MVSWSRPSDGVLAVPGRDPASRFAPPHGSLRRALLASSHARCQTCLGPGLTSGPWDAPPLEWSTMPVSSRGPRRRRSWWCHTCSSTPSTRTPAKRAGSSDSACRHGLMWDHTVFHVVPNCRASPKIVAPSKRNCRIAQRIARTPRRARGAHIEWFCSLKVAIWQVVSRHIHRRLNHRIRTGTPAQGASITSTTTRPWPCAITPQPGQPARRSQDSMSSIRPYSRRAAATRWKPSKPTSRSHRSQRLSDTEQQQVG